MRIPEDLKERLDAAARLNRRSLAAEVTLRLNESFAPDESDGDLARVVQRLQTELDDRLNDLQRARVLMSLSQSMFGLLQGHLREAGRRLSEGERKDLSELLMAIHAELQKPEPMEYMIERAARLAEELEDLGKELEELGVTPVENDIFDRLASVREQWSEFQRSRFKKEVGAEVTVDTKSAK